MIVCTFKYWIDGNLYCNGGYQECTRLFHSKKELEEEILYHSIIVIGIWKLDKMQE